MADLNNSKIDDFIDNLSQNIENIVGNRIELETQDLGKCHVLIEIKDEIHEMICEDLLFPFNGLWSGLGLFLIILIPTLILAIFLANEFRRPGDSVDSAPARQIYMQGNFMIYQSFNFMLYFLIKISIF